MKPRLKLVGLAIILGAGLAVFLKLQARQPAGAGPVTVPNATVASPPALTAPSSRSPPIASEQFIPPPADEIVLVDARDPKYGEALARIEHWFVRYLSDVDFVDRLTDQELGLLVRKLAVARLSQSVYEAQIASVERKTDGAVVISVPAYERAGARLADYVSGELLLGVTDPAQRRRVQLQFFGYGRGSQSFTVRVMRDRKGWNDESIYQIIHQMDDVGNNTPMTLGSGLPIRQLGQYAPLVRFFPKP